MYLDVGLSEGDHLRQYLCDMEVLHLVPLPRGLVQHVHLPQGQYQEPTNKTVTWRSCISCHFRESCAARAPRHKVNINYLPTISAADPDPGSGAFLTPGSGIRDG
jgi:hypothetical protein